MDKLVLCTFLYPILLRLLVLAQSHGSDFTDSALLPAENETPEPMLNVITELANLFIDIEDAFNKQTVLKTDFEEDSAEQINENYRRRSGYFNRIPKNSRNLQESTGFAVTETPSDLLASSDVIGLNIHTKEHESSLDMSVPLPMTTSLAPESSPVKEILKDKTSVSSSMDDTSTKLEANSAFGKSEETLQVTDTDIDVQKDKTRDEAQEFLLKHPPAKDDLENRIERLSQLYERIKQIRNSLIHIKSREMSQNLTAVSESVASKTTANEPQGMLDDLTSGSEMHRPPEKFLRRSVSNLIDPYVYKIQTTDKKNSKLSHDGRKRVKDTKTFKKQVPKTNLQLVLDSYIPQDSDVQLYYEKKDFIPNLIYYPVYKRQGDMSSDENVDIKEASESEKIDNSLELKVSSNKKFLLMLEPLNPLRAPLRIQESSAKPLLAFYHRSGSTELPETSDKPEIKLLLPAFFYPGKSAETGKTSDEPDIILAFASNGMPLKLGISKDIKNPITFLNDTLRESDVALNVPVELHKDGEAEPVGEDVFEVGIGDGGVIVRPRYFDLSNNEDLEDLLRTLKELKISQSSRNKQTGK
ncbi:uncharacterized protein LOC118203010 [Stegodyphus dumicola]|uniref:uncharacterized protein LOC118203010 n=1 Tax=Stegodyphus dumicola TaxID=202533 RepID=UPI0015AE0E30|nr:uncharacterized protein LOC118203010 [Stegodyphus dumicola]